MTPFLKSELNKKFDVIECKKQRAEISAKMKLISRFSFNLLFWSTTLKSRYDWAIFIEISDAQFCNLVLILDVGSDIYIYNIVNLLSKTLSFVAESSRHWNNFILFPYKLFNFKRTFNPNTALEKAKNSYLFTAWTLSKEIKLFYNLFTILENYFVHYMWCEEYEISALLSNKWSNDDNSENRNIF